MFYLFHGFFSKLLRKMKLLFILITFPCICYCEDFVLTDFSKNKLLQIGQDFGIYTEYDILPEESGTLRILNAGRMENNVTLFWLNDKRVVQSTKLEKLNAFDETKKIDLKNAQINSFEMSSDFSKIYFATDEGIYQFDVETNTIPTEILKNQFVTALSIHFEKKQLYYSDCQNEKGNLSIHDFENNKEVAKVRLDFCLKGIAYDAKTEVLFAFTKNEIYEKTSKNASLELRYFHPGATISSFAVGIKYLFFVDFQQNKNDVYKLPIIAKPLKMDQPLSYDIPPHIAKTEDGLIVLSVTDQKLLKLGRNYGIENELKIEIEKTKIKSLKYKKTPTSYKLFWIHHHNAGKVVTVEIKNKVDVIKKDISFNIPNGEDLEDIEVDDTGDNLFLGYGSDILIGKISDSTTKEFQSVDSRKLYSMRLLPNEKVLVVSGCTENKGELTKFNFEKIEIQVYETSKQLKTCIHKLDVDDEKFIFGSSSSAIYFIGSEKMIKLCSAQDVVSLTVGDTHVYFSAADDKNFEKSLFRIKKEQAMKSEDLLTEQKNPALIAFIKDIPKIKERIDLIQNFSKCSSVKTSALVSTLMLAMNILATSNHL